MPGTDAITKQTHPAIPGPSDLPEHFESWWEGSSFRETSVVGYSHRKQLAWEAYRAGSTLQAPLNEAVEAYKTDGSSSVVLRKALLALVDACDGEVGEVFAFELGTALLDAGKALAGAPGPDVDVLIAEAVRQEREGCAFAVECHSGFGDPDTIATCAGFVRARSHEPEECIHVTKPRYQAIVEVAHAPFSVKPLDWEHDYMARTPFGNYVVLNTGSTAYATFENMKQGFPHSGSMADARKAAEDDYAEKVKLIVGPGSGGLNADLLKALKDMLPPELDWRERDVDSILVHHKPEAIRAARRAASAAEYHSGSPFGKANENTTVTGAGETPDV